MNKIILKGEVLNKPVYSHEVLKEIFYKFNLSCKRESGNIDIIQCVISEVYINGIEEGKIIELACEIRTRNVPKDNERKALEINAFVMSEPIFCNSEEDIKNVNEVKIEGFVCKKVIYRVTPLGREIADILIASNRNYNKSDYIPCIAWGRNAKKAELIEPGSKVAVEGRLQSREYKKKISEDEYEDKIAYEVSIRSIEIRKE